jgi:hypothetical protein
MQYRTADQIHDPHDHRGQQCSYQHNHRRLLQFTPGRPGHFFQQLLVRLPDEGRDFVHFIHFLYAPPACAPSEKFSCGRFLASLARVLGFEPRSKVLETSILTVELYPYICLICRLWPEPHTHHTGSSALTTSCQKAESYPEYLRNSSQSLQRYEKSTFSAIRTFGPQNQQGSTGPNRLSALLT